MLCCRKYKSKKVSEEVRFPSDGFPSNEVKNIQNTDNVRIETADKISPISSDYGSNESYTNNKLAENNNTRIFDQRIYKNGDVYRGYLLNGHRHGKGMIIKKNGNRKKLISLKAYLVKSFSRVKASNVYEGDWELGVRNGYGVERFKNGTVFMGNFVNGMRCGYGEIQMPDKSTYEGTFEDGITGYGTIVWPNGDVYTGDVLDGYKHGYGYTMRNGRKIQGYYENGHLFSD